MQKNFKPRARLLLQLGEKLIKSENIALLELIKNSYDADSKDCGITLLNIDDEETGKVIIQDSGVWMTEGIIENIWLEPGADFKDMLLQAMSKKEQLDLEFAFDETKRPPIGEKGVGRFWAHKLGDVIEMVTKSALSDQEIIVSIDWRNFESEKYLEDVKFDVTKRPPQVFLNGKTGTRLTITGLKKAWTREMFRDLTRAVNGLNSPFFDKSDKFQVKVSLDLGNEDVEKDWSRDILKTDTIQKKALWKLEAEIEWNTITKFDFEFKPYSSMKKISSRKLSVSDMKWAKDGKISLEKGVDLWKFRIWKIKIVAHVFDLWAKIIRLWNQEPKPLKEYLEQNWGVRVYREGLRIYDYGEQWNDWLELDRKRINTPVDSIGNKNILAAVELKRLESQDLIEKTNREWFVENETYYEFKGAVEQVLDLFSKQRNLDKSLIREFYEGAPKNEPVNAEIDFLHSFVVEKFEDEKFDSEKLALRDKILDSLAKIKKQYQETSDILLKSAWAGLSLGIVLHEMEKRVRELNTWLRDHTLNDLAIIRDAIEWILEMIEGYAKLITSNNKKKMPLKTLLDRATFWNEFRFKAHEIELNREYLRQESDPTIKCVENIMIGVVLNLFDNSIYWLDRYDVEKKKIYVTFQNYPDGTVGVVVADNWKGFAIDAESAIKPFVSMKMGGIGLWLYIADEMMRSVNGAMVIRNYSELSEIIPEEYKDGAVIELIFPKA